MKKRLFKNTVKEAFDNLPMGICYFDTNGLPVLCNRQMHKLVYIMAERDLQMLTDLTDALINVEVKENFQKDGNAIIFPDKTVWQFSDCFVSTEEEYIQYVATDITEIYNRTKELRALNSEREKTVKGMQTIVSNVVAITREEEILRMKMHIHDKVGWFLGRLHKYNGDQNYEENKEDIVTALISMADSLRGEIGHDDVIDPLTELCRVAKNLGVTVTVSGENNIKRNSVIERLLQNAIRECVTNTIRHAEGDSLFVTAEKEHNKVLIRITNSGKQPKTDITEGGGLSSLRKQIEKAGGAMEIQSIPQFALCLTFISEE